MAPDPVTVDVARAAALLPFFVIPAKAGTQLMTVQRDGAGDGFPPSRE
jgi:hypothetical protein